MEMKACVLLYGRVNTFYKQRSGHPSESLETGARRHLSSVDDERAKSTDARPLFHHLFFLIEN